MCLYSASVALQVGSSIGNIPLVGLVFHSGWSPYLGSLVLVTVPCDGAGYPDQAMVLVTLLSDGSLVGLPLDTPLNQ